MPVSGIADKVPAHGDAAGDGEEGYRGTVSMPTE
jgi:hypothetical protein